MESRDLIDLLERIACALERQNELAEKAHAVRMQLDKIDLDWQLKQQAIIENTAKEAK